MRSLAMTWSTIRHIMYIIRRIVKVHCTVYSVQYTPRMVHVNKMMSESDVASRWCGCGVISGVVAVWLLCGYCVIHYIPNVLLFHRYSQVIEYNIIIIIIKQNIRYSEFII